MRVSEIEGRLSLAIFECTGFADNVFHSIIRVLFADLGGLASDIEGRLFVAPFADIGRLLRRTQQSWFGGTI